MTRRRSPGNGAYIVLDFGKEVGGLTFAAASDANQSVGLAFSETATYAGPSSDQSNGSGTPDGALFTTVGGASTYTVPQKFLRGGFRYLTVFLNSAGSRQPAAAATFGDPLPNVAKRCEVRDAP